MNSPVQRISGIVLAIGICAGVGADPVVLQPFKPLKVVVADSKPVTADHGSVVITDASTTSDQSSTQEFKAAVFPQRYLVTGDHVQSNASVEVSGPGGLGNHIVLDRGIVVAELGYLPLDIPEQAGNAGDIGPANMMMLRRPYPVTTIRSIGAGAEGSIILFATTVGIITAVDPASTSSVVDVVMLCLDVDDVATSELHAMEIDGSGPTVTMTLSGSETTTHFISVSITTSAAGVVTVASPVKRLFTDHARIGALRDSLNKTRTANGADFWLPGL